MGLDRTAKDTHYLIDSAGMFKVNDSGPSWKDSIGRNVMAFIAYLDKALITVLHNCVKFEGKRMVLYRHPDHKDDRTMSRDHTLMWLVGMMEFESYSAVTHYQHCATWRISDRHTFTPDLWLWMKALNKGMFRRWLFYTVAIPVQRWNRRWNNRIYKKVGLIPMEIHQDDYDAPAINASLTDKQRELRKKLYPMYAMENLGWQLWVLPDSRRKRKLQKICLEMTGEYNYLARMLFGDMDVTWEEVSTYKQMTAWRPGVWCDWRNDRHTVILSEEKSRVNAIEEDLMKRVWKVLHNAA